MFRTLFPDSRFKIYPDSVMLQKSQSLSNQSFKYNAVHMLSLNLTQKLPFEPMFSMFIIHVYYTNRFDLMISGSFFTVLVEVFTNHILAKNIFQESFGSGGIPPLRETLPASPISLSSKSFANIVFYRVENNKLQRLYCLIYSGARKVFCKIMHHKEI